MANILESAEISGVRMRVLEGLLGAPTASHSVLFMTADGLHFTDENGRVWRLAATDVTPPSGGDLLWSDDFHRADCLPLGNGWDEQVSNMMGVTSNRAVSTTAWNAGPYVCLNDGAGAIDTDDYAVEVVFPHSVIAADPYYGLFVRGQRSGTVPGYGCIIHGNAANLIVMPGWNYVTQGDISEFQAVNQDHTLRAEISGDLMSILYDGHLVIDGHAMGHAHDTGRAVGIAGDAQASTNLVVLSVSVYSLVP